MRTTLRRHPHTGRALHPVGYRRDGRPIWPILGASPDDGAGDDGSGDGDGKALDDGHEGADGADDGQGDSKQNDDTGDSKGTSKGGNGLPDDPTALKAMIADLRKENASDRTAGKQKAADDAVNDLTQKLGKALGLVKDDNGKGPDPDELTRQLTAAHEAQRQTAIELTVYRTAAKAGGDPDALLDSRSFLAKLTDLDPAKGDFSSKVEAAVKAAVKDNPKLKAGQVSGASSVDHSAGGSGEGRTRSPKSLTDAVAGHYGS